MNVTQKISIDLAWDGAAPVISAVQGDSGSRTVEVTLLSMGQPWRVPSGTSVLIRYTKPDGTGGAYDSLPDGSSAWRIKGNVLTMELAPQLCTVSGNVILSLTLLCGEHQLSSFRISLHVTGELSGDQDSEDYTNFATFLKQFGGALEDLKTRNKDNLVAAVNEIWKERGEGHTFITEAAIREDGHLLLTLSDERILDVGYVVGPEGAQGVQGETGAVGPQGDAGYTPIKGTDYYTPAEVQDVVRQAAEAAKIDLEQIAPPQFVTSVDEMTDITKHYVLDGYIWASMLQNEGALIPNFTNQLVVESEDRSSGALEVFSDYIPFQYGDILRIYHSKALTSWPGNTTAFWPYGSDKTSGSLGLTTEEWGVKINSFTAETEYATTALEDGGAALEIDLGAALLAHFPTMNWEDMAYIRLRLWPTDTASSMIVTVNEEITYTQEPPSYCFQNTGILYTGDDDIVKSVNSIHPDADGNVVIETGISPAETAQIISQAVDIMQPQIDHISTKLGCVFYNLINPDTVEAYSYINASTGIMGASKYFNASDYILLKKNTKYFGFGFRADTHYAFYDTDKSMLASPDATLTQTRDVYSCIISVGANDVYFRCTLELTRTETAYISEYFDRYYPYGEIDTVTAAVDTMKTAKLKGKRVLVIGDSISTDSYGNYEKWVTALIRDGFLPIDTTNDSIHATGFVASLSGDGDDTFIKRLEQYNDEFDLIVVFGGINDFISVIPWGEQGGDATANFVPAVDAFFDYLVRKFLHARILVISPLRTSNTNTHLGHSQQEYAQYIRDVAKSYCLPVLNLTEESGFAPFVDVVKNQWTLIPEGYSIGDGVHPNAEYEKYYLAPMIREFIGKFF